VGNPKAVVDILVKHKQLLQRPVLVKGDKAIIGRPKARIAGFLSS
jgi:arsenate reductase